METDLFRECWLKRLGLSATDWQAKAAIHVQGLPFLDKKEKRQAVEFIHDLIETFPKKFAREKSQDTLRLIEAFGLACLAFWQCGSAFPSFPQNYAAFLHQQLRRAPSKRHKEATLLADLLLTATEKEGGGCGLNRLELANPEVICESERLILDGCFEDYIKTPTKYEEYKVRLHDHPDFASEWKSLKRQFPWLTRVSGVLHRSLIPERNWERGPGAQFRTKKQRFQAAFDLFCWKYYLWGMKGDEPLLLKPSVVVTPFGTQIFIPGYMSFDARRDLDFKRINQLHKARGVMRQGPAYSPGRIEAAQKKKRVKAAKTQAAHKGLKGEERMQYIGRKSGMRTHGDHRALRRLAQ